MSPYPEALGEEHARIMLESKRLELLLILAMCVHDAYRYRASNGPYRRLLETPNEAIN